MTGSDARNGATEDQKNRNLDFKSKIIDIGGNIEWNIMGIEYGYDRNRFSPYLFAGISVFGFDPEGTNPTNGEWVRLQPLGTEGQETTLFSSEDDERRKYALTQISIPFGAGLKYNLFGPINVGMEVGLRKTFTDYLDDVSKTYVPTTKDRSELSILMGNKSLFVDAEKTKRSVEFYGSTELPARGNPDNKDWYMFAGITVTYTILPAKCFKF